jgi:hypothetical protein
VIEKKIPAPCEGRAKVEFNNQRAPCSAPTFQSQASYLARRFGLTPAIAEVIASLAFGEAR